MQALQKIEALFAVEDMCREKPLNRTKFNISTEKKIERLWHESEQHGWSFSYFTTVVLEVLTILHHRDSLQRIDHAPKPLGRGKSVLS